MKILIATTYIYRKEWPEFTKNRTGFGIMVNNIFTGISGEIETYLFSHVITGGHANVIKHTWLDVFAKAKVKDWYSGLKNFFRYKQGLKGRMRYFYYSLNAGCFRYELRRLNPDIVQIHGIGVAVKPFIDICREEHIPFVVTLHGLIGLDDTINAAKWDKDMERNFLIQANRDNSPVTVISTGMKKRIETNYLNHSAGNITVVCNGTKVPYNRQIIECAGKNIRATLGLTNEKLILVSGSICERKNQIQVIRAFSTGKITMPYHVIFCGADDDSGNLQSEINEANLQDNMHVLGFVPSEIMAEIFKEVDINLVVSKDEGYGVSIIDAFLYGVPTVAFSDLDMISNIYNEKAMVLVKDRTDNTLVEGVNRALTLNWDNNWIKEYGRGISLQNYKTKYSQEYKLVLNEGGTVSLAKTFDYLKMSRLTGYKVLAYVGNITDNKNQIALLKLMPNLKAKKIVVILAGREADEGRVRRFIIDNGLENDVILAGFCTEMGSVWQNTNLNVFLSKNDGFGLSIIEGFMHGVPSVMINDLDAAEDVHVEYGIGYIDRDDRKAILCIEEMVAADWDSIRIMKNAEIFSDEFVMKKYKQVLCQSHRNGDRNESCI